MARRARLEDIARHARVSQATVSRVLNGRPGVAESTVQAVLTALDVMGYDRPSLLRSQSVGLVGLLVPELTNPIFPAFAQVIETALARHGYVPMLCTQTPGGVHEDDYVDMLLERAVAGIISVSGLHADTEADPARYQRLKDRRLPVVLVNGQVADVPMASVSDDDVAAMDLAVTHLVSLGHRRIGLAVGPARFWPVVRKAAGFRAAMSRLLGGDPADLDELVVHELFTVEGGAAAAARLMDRGVSAVIAASDIMALGAVREVRARGLRVPADISVVGYDDSILVGFTDPPLTTIRQQVGPMGEAAVQALLRQIRHGHTGDPPVDYWFRPELVVRGSTAAASPAAPGPPLAHRRGARHARWPAAGLDQPPPLTAGTEPAPVRGPRRRATRRASPT